MTTQSGMQRDANFTAIQGNHSLLVKKTMTLAGGTANDPGDFDGTGNPATLFTVTGPNLVSIFAVCEVNLDVAGAATIEVGITGNTAALIAQTTAANIDADEVWVDNAPATIEALPSSYILGNGQDIIQTVATANITAGKLTYYCFFRPLTDTADIVAA